MFDPGVVHSNLTDDELGWDTEYDARYMDISVRELENYLCRLKSSDEYKEGGFISEGVWDGNKVNTVRFYFIRYPDDASGKGFPPSYRNKHSLAMLPAYVNRNERSEVEDQAEYYLFNYRDLGGQASDAIMTTANHNIICPPYTGCYKIGNPVAAWDIDIADCSVRTPEHLESH